jgi:hypothetical protein
LQLNDFFDYKNQLMGDLLTNEEIVHLIDSDIDLEDAADLAYSQVFPFEYIPETVEIGKTYICFDVDIQNKSLNKTFLEPILYIWVFTHKSLLRLPEGGVRTDKLCSAICEVINGSRRYGLGELNIYAAKRFAPMTDYQGKVLTFRAVEFNKVYDPKKPIPSNRKTDA